MIIDNSFVTLVLDYSKHKINRSPESFDKMFEALTQLPAYDKMVGFYSWAFTEEEYKEALFCALNDEAFKSDNEMATMLYVNLKGLKDTELLNKKVSLFNKYDFNQSTMNLKDTLPVSLKSDMTVYFTFDGINGGSILNDNEMMINFMLWPSDEKNLKAMEGILLHEYHHIGMKEILRDRGLITTTKENKDAVKKIAISVVTEGVATYLFNQEFGLFELLLESHGEDFAHNYKNSINPKNHDVYKLIEKYNRDMVSMLACENLEDAEKYMDQYCFSYEGGEPLDKTLGIHICGTIDRLSGRSKLIDLLIDPLELINHYNGLVPSTEKINCQCFV